MYTALQFTFVQVPYLRCKVVQSSTTQRSEHGPRAAFLLADRSYAARATGPQGHMFCVAYIAAEVASSGTSEIVPDENKLILID